MVIRSISDITNLIDSRYIVQTHRKNELREDNYTADGKHFVSCANLSCLDTSIDYMTCRFEDKSNNHNLPELFPYFNHNHNHNLGANCDYMVFAFRNNVFYILLFELKLYNKSNKPRFQLDMSETFANFMLNRFSKAGHQSPYPFVVRKIGIRDPQYMPVLKHFTQPHDYVYTDGYLEICGDGKTKTIKIFMDALLK